MKKILHNIILRRVLDILLSPITLFSAIWFKYIRTGNIHKMPLSEKIFRTVGMLPVNDHYYQPLVNPVKHLNQPLENDRPLPGIDWNVEEQLALAKQLNYGEELKQIPLDKKDAGPHEFYLLNHSFVPADSEFLYSMIRHFKPKRFVEIGCGYSTMMAVKAEAKNALENDPCKHTCIEPYEMPWLEKLNVEVIRKKVEDVPLHMFTQLQANDILFIDSSHIIRPQGDVLYEFLDILPRLNSGVVIHVHDIFTPKDYPREWVVDEHRLWNEQYLLEAFLSCNKQFKIKAAVNFLKTHYRKQFNLVCPLSGTMDDDVPGSFWMIRHNS
jgi:predicted O-methyltransferase YrrM